MRMHKITTIAKRDYIATVRTKAFIFGLVVAPMLFGGGSIAMTFFKGQPDLKDRRVAIVDHTGVVAGPLVSAAREKNDRELFGKITHRQIAPRYVFEVIAPAADSKNQLLALSDRVRRKQLVAFLEIGKDALRPPKPAGDSGEETSEKTDPDTRVSYYTNAGGIDEMRIWLNGPINDGVRLARLAQLGIDIEQATRTWRPRFRIEGLSLVERDEKTGESAGGAQTQRIGSLRAHGGSHHSRHDRHGGLGAHAAKRHARQEPAHCGDAAGRGHPIRAHDRQSAGFGRSFGDQFHLVCDRRRFCGERPGSRRPVAAHHHPLVLRVPAGRRGHAVRLRRGAGGVLQHPAGRAESGHRTADALHHPDVHAGHRAAASPTVCWPP